MAGLYPPAPAYGSLADGAALLPAGGTILPDVRGGLSLGLPAQNVSVYAPP
jgi:hypothetical protein